MSWLLVALVPGLLMAVTFGLQKLESGLDRDTVSATDVAEFLAQAAAADVDTLARDGMGRALDCLHERLHAEDAARTEANGHHTTPSLPTRLYLHHRGNTEFRRTPHANRV